jgi:YidC/Oxa1 family membrane protein insertase
MIRGLSKKSLVLIRTRTSAVHNQVCSVNRITLARSGNEKSGSFGASHNVTTPFSTTCMDSFNRNDDDLNNRRVNANRFIPSMGTSVCTGMTMGVGLMNTSTFCNTGGCNGLPLTQKRNLWGLSWGRSKKPAEETPTETTIVDTDLDMNTVSPTTPVTETSSVQISPEEAMAQFEQLSNATTEVAIAAATTETSSKEWVSTWWPQDQMLDFIVYTHDISGLNYAFTIGAITLTFRSLMLPLFMKSQQNTARMAHLKPEMDVLKQKIDKLDPKDMQKQQEYAKEMQRLFLKYNVNPLKGLILPLVQMPVFMSMFFALRKMPDYFHDELSTGGILWFVDLTLPDAYYVMPVFSGLSLMAMMEVSKKSMMASSPEQGKMMLTFFRVMGVLLVPFAMYFPTCLLCYWTVNNSFSLAQSVMFNNPTVRKGLGIWDLPKAVPSAGNKNENKGMMEMLQDSMNSKRKEGNDSNLKQRIELHNAAVEERRKQKKSRGK